MLVGDVGVEMAQVQAFLDEHAVALFLLGQGP